MTTKILICPDVTVIVGIFTARRWLYKARVRRYQRAEGVICGEG